MPRPLCHAAAAGAAAPPAAGAPAAPAAGAAAGSGCSSGGGRLGFVRLLLLHHDGEHRLFRRKPHGDALRKRQVLRGDGLVELELGDVVRDLHGDCRRQAAHRQFSIDVPEYAAGDDAFRLPRRLERDLDVQEFVFLNLEEVRVQERTGHGVILEVREQHHGLLAALDAELDDRVAAVFGAENRDDVLRRNGDVRRRELGSVRDRGNAPGIAKPLDGALAGFGSRLNGKFDRLHGGSHSLAREVHTNSELTESFLWMRRIASPSNLPTER